MLPTHLSSIQSHLEEIYQLEDLPSVEPFVLLDAKLADNFSQAGANRTAVLSEQLFIHSESNELLISLYLDEDLLNRVEKANPYDAIHQSNLAEYCTVLEGVSHFLYLVSHAQAGHSVRAIELELQAEVDKFIGILTLCGLQAQSIEIFGLVSWLFGQIKVDRKMEPDLKRRYCLANFYAHKYCIKLLRTHMDGSGVDRERLFKDLRYFYRLNFPQKVAHIS